MNQHRAAIRRPDWRSFAWREWQVRHVEQGSDRAVCQVDQSVRLRERTRVGVRIAKHGKRTRLHVVVDTRVGIEQRVASGRIDAETRHVDMSAVGIDRGSPFARYAVAATGRVALARVEDQARRRARLERYPEVLANLARLERPSRHPCGAVAQALGENARIEQERAVDLGEPHPLDVGLVDGNRGEDPETAAPIDDERAHVGGMLGQLRHAAAREGDRVDLRRPATEAAEKRHPVAVADERELLDRRRMLVVGIALEVERERTLQVVGRGFSPACVGAVGQGFSPARSIRIDHAQRVDVHVALEIAAPHHECEPRPVGGDRGQAVVRGHADQLNAHHRDGVGHGWRPALVGRDTQRRGQHDEQRTARQNRTPAVTCTDRGATRIEVVR
jgi:hypothetical protein